MLGRLLASPTKTASRATPGIAPERAALFLDIGDARHRITVRRSGQARRYTLRLKPRTRELILTLPLGASLSSARAFLARNEAWIAQRVAHLPDAVPFEPGRLIPIGGIDHLIVHRPAARGTVWIEPPTALPPPGFDWSGPLIVVAGDRAHLPRRVRDYLKRLARSELERAALAYVARLGTTLRRISIKDTTSRWGSCSASGALSFSWRIVMAPPLVLDYLAAHEVAHRREMNHSARYWQLLRDICPHTDEAERWLKAHGAGLHRYG